MVPNVSVPMNFGLKLLDSPTHNTLELKASQGMVVRASSVILSFNSPVIDHMTTSLHLTSVDMEEFSKEAVRYFVDAAYSGQSPPISRNLFRDIHKLANVFQMSWLVIRCVQQFTDIAQSLQEPSYEDLLFLFDEAVYVLSQLKSRELVETALSKIRTLNKEQNFIRNYLVDLNSLSTQQLDLIIELAGTSVEYIVEPLTEQLTASLEKGDNKVPANSKYLLENCELHHCQIYHERSCDKLFDVLQQFRYPSFEDSKWVLQIHRKTTAAALKLAIFPRASKKTELVKRTATSAFAPNSIPNLFHSIDLKMSFDEVLDWLGNSTEVTNLIMFFEGLWTWMFTNNYKHSHKSPAEILPRLIEIKEKRGWNPVYYDWLTLWRCEKNHLISIIQSNRKLCTLDLDMKKWATVSNLRTFHNVTSIFEKETELYFDVSSSVALDKSNCLSHGKCGLILKTVPAKDGANVVLCTDPAEYPKDMHFHKEFPAKDMHLTAYFTKPGTKWISASTMNRYDDVASIFERETILKFQIRQNSKLDKRNCGTRGLCGVILKTVPAKDGANVVLCTDPAEYPKDMHYHKEFKAKNMHLTAYNYHSVFFYIPLSWHRTPVSKDGFVYWGDILSKRSGSNCRFFLIIDFT